MAISSTPLWKLISYSFQFSVGTNTCVLCPLTAFSSLWEPIPASSIPLQLSVPYRNQRQRPPLPYGNQFPAASVLLFPDLWVIRPHHSLLHGPYCHRSKQVYRLMPCMGMKAIHTLVTHNCGFKKAVSISGHLVVFIKIQAHN